MRRSALLAVIVAAVVVVVMISSFFAWRNKANQEKECEKALTACWSSVVSTLQTLGTTINSRNLDFSDISSRSADCHAKLKDVKKSLEQLDVPKKYLGSKTELVALIDESLSLLEEVKNSSDSWKSANFRELELKISSVKQAAQDTFSAWPETNKNLVQPDLEVLTGIPTSFNKMRVARKPEPRGLVVVTGTPPSPGLPPGWTLVTTPSRPGVEVAYSSASADYLRSMQSLLRGYKGLRGDLEDYIAVAKRVGRVLDSAYTQQFDNAYASRQNIYQAMTSLCPPPEFAARHQRAVSCLERGMAAMNALKNGDYQTFHELSEQNTPALESTMNDYGL